MDARIIELDALTNSNGSRPENEDRGFHPSAVLSHNEAVDRLLDLAYPVKCGLCGEIGEAGLCSACQSGFAPVDFPLALSGLDYIYALFRYEGRAGQAVRRLKFERVTSLARPMSALMAAAPLPPGYVVTPVPIHWSRRCLRGFNQAELLAQGFGETEKHLVRIRRTRPQVGLPRPERLKNLMGAFDAEGVSGKSILLVDDVVTTGGTALACADALRKAGALRVGLLCFCAGVPD